VPARTPASRTAALFSACVVSERSACPDFAIGLAGGVSLEGAAEFTPRSLNSRTKLVLGSPRSRTRLNRRSLARPG
jgi:hypothetical protein